MSEEYEERVMVRRDFHTFPEAEICGVTLRKGDLIHVKVKERKAEELVGEFQGFNPVLALISIKCGTRTYVIKLSEIKYFWVEDKDSRQEQ